MKTWIRSVLGMQRQPVRPRRSSVKLMVEELESRIVPIVGAFGAAPVVTPGMGYDAVVRINNAVIAGTGTLINTQSHILTAAHVVGGTAGNPFPDTQVTFQLSRTNPNVAGATIDVSIPIKVPANVAGGSTYQLVPGGAGYTLPAGGPVWNRANFSINDIAILRLVDQVNPKPDRLLVAPRGASPAPAGFALSYAPFAGANEAGRQFSEVGFGMDGIGNEGNNANEVQQILLTNIPLGPVVGTFKLSFDPGGGAAVQTTGNIASNATPQVIAQQLVGLAGIGKDAAGNDNVNVVEIQTGVATSRTFQVRFVNALGSRNLNRLTAAVVAGGGGFAADTKELFNGSNTTGTKRVGINRFDVVDPANAGRLLFDFDNGLAAQDANNVPALGGPDLGFGALETFAAPGDSGGPLFVNPGGGNPLQIAGVMSGLTSSAADIRDYVDSAGTKQSDSSFGEVGLVTRVSQFINNFINPATAGKYTIVFDMNQQLLGRDGVTENLTITASVVRGDLVIEVAGSADPRFNGEYYRQPIANINSLTIRTTKGDNYTINTTVPIPVTEQIASNKPPVPKADTAVTMVNTPVPVKVLANDSDPDSDFVKLTGKFSSINNGSGEKVVVNDNGTPGDPSDDYLIYTPATNFVGSKNFTYQVTDSQGHLVYGTVHVSVSPDGLELIPTVNGQSKTSLVFTKESGDGREMGLFLVDGADGHIGSFMPGDSGYNAAALARKSVLFSAGAPAGTTASIQLSAGKYYGSYAGTGSEIVFSINAANSGGQDRFGQVFQDGLTSGLTLTGDAFVARILAEIVAA